MIAIVLGWILFSVAVAIAAERKYNRSRVGWLIISIVTSPVFALLLLWALGPIMPAQPKV